MISRISMEFNHICSLGSLCHTATVMQKLQWKKESYPFDWIFSGHIKVLHCLEDDFKMFLDKSYYIDHASGSTDKCGHSYYGAGTFNHRNPRKEDDHEYYVRTVDRFKKLLNTSDSKLFIMMLTNLRATDDSVIKQLNTFNTDFAAYAGTYTLLAILHRSEQENTYHEFRYDGNIHYLILHTVSKSYGTGFIDKTEDLYLENLLRSSYCVA